MKKRVLFVAVVFCFFDFEKSDMEILQQMGFEIHIAARIDDEDDDGRFDYLQIKKHNIDFSRLPFSKQSIIAYKQLKRLLEDIHFDIIHCHTPIAAAITRLAAIDTRKNGTKVIYTDHGFHFHKTSGCLTWFLYYPLEYICSFYTDMILTINKEDWNVIQRFPVKEKRYIPGVGVDVKRIMQMAVNRAEIRKQFNLPENAFVILSVGELSVRKNHEVIIKAISKLNIPNIYYLICGEGSKREYLEKLVVASGLSDQIIFAGATAHETVLSLGHAIDLGAVPSLIEGLGLTGIEILAAGKPLVASNVHGINDYVKYGKTGISCPPHDVEAFSQAIYKMYSDKQFYEECRKHTQEKAFEFDIEIVKNLMITNYQYVINETKKSCV